MRIASKNSGLTLVELVVAITITMILAGIFLSVARSAVGKAKGTSCVSNLRQLGAAFHLYANDWNDYLPCYTTNEIWISNSEPGQGPFMPTTSLQPRMLIESMRPYIKDDRLWFCPDDPYAGKNVFVHYIRHEFTSYFYAPGWADTGVGWPPFARLSSDKSKILLFDASAPSGAGASDPARTQPNKPATIHSDGTVNLLYTDLSVKTTPVNKLWAAPSQ